MERTLLCRQWSAKVTNFYKTLPVLNGMVLRWSTLVNNDNVFYEQDFDLWCTNNVAIHLTIQTG